LILNKMAKFNLLVLLNTSSGVVYVSFGVIRNCQSFRIFVRNKGRV